MKQMVFCARFLVLAAASLISATSLAAQIVGVRSWSGGDTTRLVLELDGTTEFRVSEDSTPGRIIILLPGANTTIEGPRWPAQVGALEAMRLDTLGMVREVLEELFAVGQLERGPPGGHRAGERGPRLEQEGRAGDQRPGPGRLLQGRHRRRAGTPARRRRYVGSAASLQGLGARSALGPRGRVPGPRGAGDRQR